MNKIFLVHLWKTISSWFFGVETSPASTELLVENLGMPTGRIFDYGLCLRKKIRKVEPGEFRTEKPAGF